MKYLSICLLLACLVLAGCGSSANDTPPDPKSGPQQKGDATAEKKTASLEQGSPSLVIGGIASRVSA